MTRKQIVLVIIILAALIAALITYAVWPKTTIKLAIAPLNAQLQIDGESAKQVDNGDSVSIKPGEHKVTLSQNEFTSYSTTITVEKGKKTELLIALKADTDAAQQLLSSDEAQAIVQRFNGNVIKKETNDLTTDYPILKALPITARLYSIHPCDSIKYPDDKTKLAICIDSDTETSLIKPYVEKDVQSHGYDLNDYEEVYYTMDLSQGD